MNSNDQVFTVHEFISIVNNVFSDLGSFKVQGEVAQLKFSRNNAVFIDLKDKTNAALLKISNFAPRVDGLTAISEGMEVTVEGYLEIYAPTGSLNFKAFKINPVGEGSLKQAFENLKLALENEGLFALNRKRELSSPIKKIALITAGGSAALADFTKILQESLSAIEIDFYSVLVQGNQAEDEIEKAIYSAALTDIDAIVLIRGGGSLEDLKAFNSEKIARAIFTSRIPVVVGVGHEVDITIADLVADVRASTPSQAAYYLHSRNLAFIESINEKLEQMYIGLNQEITIKKNALAKIDNVKQLLLFKIESASSQVNNAGKLLTAYNPMNVLKRGFVLIRDEAKYISSIKDLTSNKKIRLQLKDGEVNSVII